MIQLTTIYRRRNFKALPREYTHTYFWGEGTLEYLLGETPTYPSTIYRSVMLKYYELLPQFSMKHANVFVWLWSLICKQTSKRYMSPVLPASSSMACWWYPDLCRDESVLARQPAELYSLSSTLAWCSTSLTVLSEFLAPSLLLYSLTFLRQQLIPNFCNTCLNNSIFDLPSLFPCPVSAQPCPSRILVISVPRLWPRYICWRCASTSIPTGTCSSTELQIVQGPHYCLFVHLSWSRSPPPSFERIIFVLIQIVLVFQK